jgi:hypothetical protein
MHDQLDLRSGATRPPLFGVPTPAANGETTSALRSTLNSINWLSTSVRELADLVGGIDALEDLDAEPLPDEPFNWMGVRDSHRPLVEEVLDALDAVLGTSSYSPIDVEYRTITRRLLSRVADRDPSVLSGTSATRIAAALTWIAMSGNEDLKKGTTLSAQDLWALFGVTNTTDRGRTLYRAMDFILPEQEWQYYSRRRSDVLLADARFMHSRNRSSLIRRRGELIRAIRQERGLGAAKHSITLMNGYIHTEARPITPRSAQRSAADGKRPVIAVTLGERRGDNEVVALTIYDAQRLVVMLEQALVSQYAQPHPDDDDDDREFW